MSTPVKPVTSVPAPPARVNYQLATPAVVVAGVKPDLLAFVDFLGLVHRVLFAKVLYITSGKDSLHAASSLHAAGLAVDIRTKDLLPDEQLVLLNLLAFAAPSNHIGVFDERDLLGEPHIHLEYRGA